MLKRKPKLNPREKAMKTLHKMRELGMHQDEMQTVILLMMEESIEKIAEKLAGKDE